MQGDIDRQVQRGHFAETVRLAMAATVAEWASDHSDGAGVVTLAALPGLLRKLEKVANSVVAPRDGLQVVSGFAVEALEKLSLRVLVVEPEQSDLLSPPKDVRTVAEQEIERITTAAGDATRVLEILSDKDASVEQVREALARVTDLESVEDLLDAMAPGKPAILGPTGTLFDMNQPKLPKHVRAKDTYVVRVHVHKVDPDAGAASVRLDVSTDPVAMKLLHRTTSVLEMSFHGVPLAREYLWVSRAADAPLELKVTMQGAVLSRDAHRSTLRLQSVVGFADGLTMGEVRERIERLTLRPIEAVLERLAKLPE